MKGSSCCSLILRLLLRTTCLLVALGCCNFRLLPSRHGDFLSGDKDLRFRDLFVSCCSCSLEAVLICFWHVLLLLCKRLTFTWWVVHASSGRLLGGADREVLPIFLLTGRSLFFLE